MWTRLRIALVERLTYWIVTRLIPQRVGPLMRLVFKLPLFFHRLGCFWLIPGWLLILETTGRRSGKPRRTALEYGDHASAQAYFLMSGWNGRSDWYRNARANPRVRLWLGRAWQEGVARPAADEEVVDEMEGVMRVAPRAVRIWAAHSGVSYDGTRASLLRMARAFPSLVVEVGKASA